MFYLIAFVVSVGLEAVYFFNDRFTDETFTHNISTYLSDQPYSSFRGVVWSMVLFLAVCFVRSSAYQRKYYQFELNKEQKIEDYSLAIMDVPTFISDTELKSHFAYYVGGEAKIKKMLRVSRPRLLQLDTKLQAVY